MNKYNLGAQTHFTLIFELWLTSLKSSKKATAPLIPKINLRTVPLGRMLLVGAASDSNTLAPPLVRLSGKQKLRSALKNKMGQTNGTPVLCHLCSEETGDPVTLKCNHRFCQRCIGDLWSVTPDGPYHCPEWMCKTTYRTLPFDRTLLRHQPSAKKRHARPPSSAGTRTERPSGTVWNGLEQ